jgi:hypothetical protein
VGPSVNSLRVSRRANIESGVDVDLNELRDCAPRVFAPYAAVCGSVEDNRNAAPDQKAPVYVIWR